MFFLRIQALLLLLSFSIWAEEIAGRVVRVTDGDTITVLDAAKTQHKIRLHGIDAPEKKQAFGNISRKHLSSLVADKDVSIQYKSHDRYGRVLGTVFVDGKDANLQMLQAGLAWHYKKYDSTPTYAQAESEARAAKRGIWQDAQPIAPWNYRKAMR